MRIALCDDNWGQLNILSEAVRNCELWQAGEIQVDCFTSGAELLNSVRSDIEYEFIFLDIEMPELSGLSVFSEINSLCDSPVIFVSTHIELLPEALALQPHGFLAKPYNQDTFNRTVKSVIGLKADRYFFHFIYDGKKEVINCRDILYFSISNYVLTMYRSGDSSVVLSRKGLDEVESETVEFGFFRCNRSVLVNLYYCSGRKDNRLIMRGTDAKIEVSRRRIKEFDKQLILYRMGDKNAF